ncbi:hypothetical protein V0288_04605 [Pannus brasiliensis CCIBt3594]|uniref:Uncharacterized protein n=1 Tax=Pannus brasiliensis CCIBt3594 TaxID=1427578 RepID=A0AAW9QQA5_9CHRO
MARRRFNDLEEQFQAWLAAAAPGTSPTTIPNAKLRNYALWKLGEANDASAKPRDLPQSSTRDRGGIKNCIIKPFGNPTILVVTTVSNRAFNWIKGQSDLRGELHWQNIPAANATTKPNTIKGFESAKAIFRERLTNPVERRSRITNETYKSRTSSSSQGYVLPFGVSATEAEITRQRDIELKTPNGFSASFKSERFVDAPDLVDFSSTVAPGS